MATTYVSEGDLATPANFNKWFEASVGDGYNVKAASFHNSALTDAVGDGTTNDRAAIAGVDTVAQALTPNAAAVYFPPGTYLVSTALTITSDVIFAPGAKIKPAASVTVTINGAIHASATQYIFDITNAGASFSFGTGSPPAYFSAKWFGAVGDGTDANAEIQAAINAADDVGGGAVYIPPGTYLISSLLVDNGNSKLEIFGSGRASTILNYTATTGNIITIRENTHIHHLNIAGPWDLSNTASTGSENAIYFEDGYGGIFGDVDHCLITQTTTAIRNEFDQFSVSNCHLTAKVGIAFDGSVGGSIQIAGCRIDGLNRDHSGTRGLAFTANVTHLGVIDTNIERFEYGIYCGSTGPHAMVLTNVHIEASKVTDVYVDSGCKSFTAVGCRFGSSGSPPTRNIHLVHSTAVAVLSSCRFMGYNNGATKDGIKTHADAQLHLVGQNWIDGADFTIADIDNGSPNGTIVKYASFGPDQAVTGNGNLTVDFALGGNIQINLTGNTALQAPSNVIIGALYYIRFSQDGSGGHTVSFTAGWKNNASINTTADKKTGTLWVGIGQGVLAQIANLQEA